MIQVAAGIVLRDEAVLVAKRHFHQHQGERWEFPGGKVEPFESHYDALVRELREEVAIDVKAAEFFMSVDYTYPEKAVQLHFFRVTSFAGEPKHQEGQLLCWTPVSELSAYDFPDANQAVVDRLISEFSIS